MQYFMQYSTTPGPGTWGTYVSKSHGYWVVVEKGALWGGGCPQGPLWKWLVTQVLGKLATLFLMGSPNTNQGLHLNEICGPKEIRFMLSFLFPGLMCDGSSLPVSLHPNTLSEPRQWGDRRALALVLPVGKCLTINIIKTPVFHHWKPLLLFSTKEKLAFTVLV